MKHGNDNADKSDKCKDISYPHPKLAGYICSFFKSITCLINSNFLHSSSLCVSYQQSGYPKNITVFC